MKKQPATGYTQVYTGNGKGKTTAALGLAIRACGSGMKVYIGQFMKGRSCCEHAFIRKHAPGIRIERYGCACFVTGKPSEKDMLCARKGLARFRRALASGKYGLLIADELNVAVACGLLATEDILGLIRDKPDQAELIITGRGAHRRVIAAADLVTEMREVKHYFSRGVWARAGIEH